MSPLFIPSHPLAIAYTLISEDEEILIEENLALMVPVTLYLDGTIDLEGYLVEI